MDYRDLARKLPAKDLVLDLAVNLSRVARGAGPSDAFATQVEQAVAELLERGVPGAFAGTFSTFVSEWSSREGRERAAQKWADILENRAASCGPGLAEIKADKVLSALHSPAFAAALRAVGASMAWYFGDFAEGKALRSSRVGIIFDVASGGRRSHVRAAVAKAASELTGRKSSAREAWNVPADDVDRRTAIRLF